ncbi:MAG: translation initiation factor IF-2 [Chitinispirillales bacterium]|jgi:translation initiation factor IF-2|nr:translation initiation factor IF-2 [Chitinispirillales bacterium]
MAIVKVSQLAKDMGLTSNVVISVLHKLGYSEIKAHNSVVDAAVKEQILSKMKEETAAAKQRFAENGSRAERRKGTAPSHPNTEQDSNTQLKQNIDSAEKNISEKKHTENAPRRFDGSNGGRGNYINRNFDSKKDDNSNRTGGFGGHGNSNLAWKRNIGKERGDNFNRPNGDFRNKDSNSGRTFDNRFGGNQNQGFNGNQNQGFNDRRGNNNFGQQNKDGNFNRSNESFRDRIGNFNNKNGGNFRGRNDNFTGGAGGRGQGNSQDKNHIAGINSNYAKELADNQAKLQNSEDNKSRKKKVKKRPVKDAFQKHREEEFEMKSNVRKTITMMGIGNTKKKYKKDKIGNEDEEEGKKILSVSEFISVSEFAKMVEEDAGTIIARCMDGGLLVTINQRLDFPTIQMLSEEFGYEAQLLDEFVEKDEDEEINQYEAFPRPPVVTVMGHVDHGKTSLLDYIRKSNVIAGESGGITQHIAAYSVETKTGIVTFLDTPGHEAFAAMRARGSQITDVVVLVIAADSGVMPQTKEAIDHAKAAGVPLVVAINKIDLPTANPDKVKADLANYGVLVESYGGKVQSVEISAKKGVGIDNLLELLALETEMLDLKSPLEGYAKGVVIESELDKGKGALATVLIQSGTLRKGDVFYTGTHSGKVREMLNEHGNKVKEVPPGHPAIILGLSGTPQAGDSFKVCKNEKEAKEIAAKRRLAEKERELRNMYSAVSLANLSQKIKEGKILTLNIIVRGDVDGSVEAVAGELQKLSTDEIKVNIVLKGVGGIKETDIMLAQASNAIIIGFHINPNPKIRASANDANVEIKTFRIIYEAIEEVRSAMIGMLAPDIKEEIMGQVEIRELFKIPKVGNVAGCYVLEGKVERNSSARLIREDIEIADTKIETLQRFKDQVKEVLSGFDCGLTLTKVSDYKIGDRIEVYKEVEIKRKSLER